MCENIYTYLHLQTISLYYICTCTETHISYTYKKTLTSTLYTVLKGITYTYIIPQEQMKPHLHYIYSTYTESTQLIHLLLHSYAIICIYMFYIIQYGKHIPTYDIDRHSSLKLLSIMHYYTCISIYICITSIIHNILCVHIYAIYININVYIYMYIFFKNILLSTYLSRIFIHLLIILIIYINICLKK